MRDESMRVDDDAMVVMIQRDGCKVCLFLITNATRRARLTAGNVLFFVDTV